MMNIPLISADNGAGNRLSGRVWTGYALGSLVTGAFGTVPGLLLLKAWDVLFNRVAGRISDRTPGLLGAAALT